MEKSKLLKAALWYARKGWYVLPLKAGLKVPASTHGLSDATIDPEQIKTWWAADPSYNVGVSCGPSGIVALDVDPKNGADPAVVESDFGAEATDTLTNLTPSGGLHYVYAMGDREVRNSASKLGLGLDIRGLGGYIVVPPSIVDGRAYSWEVGSAPSDRDPAPLPEKLLKQLSKRGPTLAGATVTELIPKGERNSYLAAIAGRLRRNGLSAAEIDAALQAANTGRCRPPLSADEVKNIARSIARYEPSDPVRRAKDALGLLRYDDICRLTSEPVQWCVEGLVRSSGILLLAGRPKAGKSTLSRNLASSVAKGGYFLGRRCRKGSVLWVGLEETVDELRECIEAMGANELPIAYRLDPFKGDQINWLRAAVEQERPSLVIIDTIGRFSALENITDYSQVTRATQPIIDLRNRFGTTFCLNHHTNNAGSVYGGTIWEAVPDISMVLSKNEDQTRFVKTVSYRSGVVPMEDLAVEFDESTGLVTAAESRFIVDQRKAEQKILTIARDGEMRSRETLARAAGGRSIVARAAVDALVAQGLLKSQGTGARGDPRLYGSLAPSLYTTRDITYEDVSQAARPRANIRENGAGTNRDEESRRKPKQSEETEETESSEETVQTDEEVDLLMKYAEERFGGA